MLVTEKRMAGADGAPIQLTVWEPDGPAKAVLQIVHGLGESAGRYKRWARQLTGLDWAVYAHDLRGHGKSPGKRGGADYDTLLDDIRAVRTRIAAEQPDLPVSLYGHSLGGSLAIRRLLDHARDYARAAVTGPWFAPRRDYPAQMLAAMRALERAAPNFTLYLGQHGDAAGDAPHTRVGLRLFLQALESGIDAVDSAGDIQTPLLVLCGEEDRAISHDAVTVFALTAFAAARREGRDSFVTLRAYPRGEGRHGEGFEHILAFLEGAGGTDA